MSKTVPAEWAPHQACLMEWPTRTRASLWGGLLDDAKRDYATVARAIAAFEPVIMVADPAQADEARDHCGSGIEILPVPIDDSWMRDNGPIFVADPQGRLALVHFRFNSWGERYLPTTATRWSRRRSPRTLASADTPPRSSWRAARSSWTARARCSPPSSAC